jgi:hypothetical protein
MPARCSNVDGGTKIGLGFRLGSVCTRRGWLVKRPMVKLGAINAYETAACRILYHYSDSTGGSRIALNKELAISLSDTRHSSIHYYFIAQAAIVASPSRIPYSHGHELTLSTTTDPADEA